MHWADWTEAISMAATVAFAVTAVLAIREDRDIDLLGAAVLGLITAIGGGTMRDLILDVPVFWSADLSCIWVGTAASVMAFYGRRLFASRHLYSITLYLDDADNEIRRDLQEGDSMVKGTMTMKFGRLLLATVVAAAYGGLVVSGYAAEDSQSGASRPRTWPRNWSTRTIRWPVPACRGRLAWQVRFPLLPTALSLASRPRHRARQGIAGS